MKDENVEQENPIEKSIDILKEQIGFCDEQINQGNLVKEFTNQKELREQMLQTFENLQKVTS